MKEHELKQEDAVRKSLKSSNQERIMACIRVTSSIDIR